MEGKVGIAPPIIKDDPTLRGGGWTRVDPEGPPRQHSIPEYPQIEGKNYFPQHPSHYSALRESGALAQKTKLSDRLRTLNPMRVRGETKTAEATKITDLAYDEAIAKINRIADTDRIVTDAINTGLKDEIEDAKYRAINRAAMSVWGRLQEENPGKAAEFAEKDPAIKRAIEDYQKEKAFRESMATGRVISATESATPVVHPPETQDLSVLPEPSQAQTEIPSAEKPVYSGLTPDAIATIEAVDQGWEPVHIDGVLRKMLIKNGVDEKLIDENSVAERRHILWDSLRVKASPESPAHVIEPAPSEQATDLETAAPEQTAPEAEVSPAAPPAEKIQKIELPEFRIGLNLIDVTTGNPVYVSDIHEASSVSALDGLDNNEITLTNTQTGKKQRIVTEELEKQLRTGDQFKLDPVEGKKFKDNSGKIYTAKTEFADPDRRVILVDEKGVTVGQGARSAFDEDIASGRFTEVKSEFESAASPQNTVITPDVKPEFSTEKPPAEVLVALPEHVRARIAELEKEGLDGRQIMETLTREGINLKDAVRFTYVQDPEPANPSETLNTTVSADPQAPASEVSATPDSLEAVANAPEPPSIEPAVEAELPIEKRLEQKASELAEANKEFSELLRAHEDDQTLLSTIRPVASRASELFRQLMELQIERERGIKLPGLDLSDLVDDEKMDPRNINAPRVMARGSKP